MIQQVAQFQKVSLKQFQAAVYQCSLPLADAQVMGFHQNLPLPVRATAGSAGYDFFAPFAFTLAAGETLIIPTGIRAQISPGWLLALLPRSSHGFQYRLQLDNTMGIVDADYYYSDNEGHIFVKLTNDSRRENKLMVQTSERFAQGIFLQHGIVVGDQTAQTRTGGFGSTGR